MPERMTDALDIVVLTDDAENLYQELVATDSKKVGELSTGGSSWQLPDGSILDVRESQQPWVVEAIANPNIAPDNLPIIGLPYGASQFGSQYKYSKTWPTS